MNGISEMLFKRSFKDSAGNTMFFFKENGKIYIGIDGNECSEGIEEEINSFDEAVETLEWYNYNEFSAMLKNNNIKNI